jgi:hypothetical protein
VRLPEALWNRTLEMTLEAAAHYRPALANGSQDRRKLCYIVRGIGYSQQYVGARRAHA